MFLMFSYFLLVIVIEIHSLQALKKKNRNQLWPTFLNSIEFSRLIAKHIDF